MKPPARWALARTLVALALGAALAPSCLGPVVPIPPPGVSSFALELCAPAQCPEGGLVVRAQGTARDGALVVLENLTRTTPEGSRYLASTYARRAAGAPDAGPDVPAQGVYDLVLGPVPGAMGAAPTVSREGDRVVLYQYTRDEGGVFRLSSTTSERVLRAP